MLTVSSVCGCGFLFFIILQMMKWNQVTAGASRLANVVCLGFFFCRGWVDSDPCPSESKVEGQGLGRGDKFGNCREGL